MTAGSAGTRPPVDWWSAASLRLHATMLLGVAGCVAAGAFEYTRARAGHPVAWLYTVEWPMFAVFGIYVWWRLLHGEPADRRRRSLATAATDAPTDDVPDEQLIAWQQYLQRLHATDPPGGPPDS